MAPLRRSDLLATYARPYRRWVPVAMRGYGVHRAAAATALMGVLAAILELALDAGRTLLALTIAAAIITVLYALWAAFSGVLLVRDRTTEWREPGGELGRVRARRPHAAEADREVVHDEYAVAVDDARGCLVTFHFTPLDAGEQPASDARLLPGTPRYDVRRMSSVEYEPRDAARAAEQLAEAQDHAARLEAAAIERAREELANEDAARELLAETQSTGAALRSLTGQ